MGWFGLGSKKNKHEEPIDEAPIVDDSSYDDDWDDEDDSDDEPLSVYDAALIWMSNGKDEDYMFGYTEEELEAAL